MLQSEATTALREVFVTLFTPAGNRATGVTGCRIKIRKPGGNWVTANASDVTELTGAAANGGGDYVFTLSAGEVDTIGSAFAYEVSKDDGTIQSCSGSIQIDPALRAVDVGTGAITATTFAAGAVNAAAIAASAITSTTFAAGAINAAAIASNAITAAKVASDTLTAIGTAVVNATVYTAGVARTVKGILTRNDRSLIGKWTGLLSSTVTAFMGDGTTAAFVATQDTTAGTREAASSTSGD